MQVKPLLDKMGKKVPATVAAGFAIFATTVILSTTSIQTTTEKDVAVGNTASVAGPLVKLCNRDDDTAKLLRSARTPEGKGLCDTANAVLARPTVQAIALTDDRVVSLVRQELARQPAPASVAPTLSQVTDAVRAVMTTNPVLFKGEKGNTPSSSEISSIVTAYIRANPEQFRGEAGKDADTAGMDGRLAALQREVDQLKSRGATDSGREPDRGNPDPRTRDSSPRDPRPPVTRTRPTPTRTEGPPPAEQSPRESGPSGSIGIN
jgi:hypothetical protein